MLLSDSPGLRAVITLATCCKDRGASCEMPPGIIDMVGGHRPIEPDTNIVSPACRIKQTVLEIFIQFNWSYADCYAFCHFK